MRRIVSLLLGGALLAGLGTFPAEAAPGKGKNKGNAKTKARKDPKQVFQKKDKDGNGSLNLDEMRGKNKGGKDPAKIEARFKRLDKDKNGALSLAELQGGAKRKKKG